MISSEESLDKTKIDYGMTEIQNRLFALQDVEYAKFQSKLTPGIDPQSFIGVRVPDCRELGRELRKHEPDIVADFFTATPHEYYDENILHGILISEIRDFDSCIKALEAFLPYVDNWAVCDILSPKCFRKNRKELLPLIDFWMNDSREYIVRFGIEMLMSHYLDEDFRPEYLEKVASVRSDRYYINMMIAWYFATALAKQWDSAVPYLESKKLDIWVHNKTIQKARESYRITDGQKTYLSGLKR